MWLHFQLVSNANSDLQAVRDELTLKEEELKAMRDEYNELQAIISQ